MINEIIAALSAAIVAGAFGWAALETRRSRTVTHAKLDQIDVILRGDGNGNVGIAERVRAVQTDLSGLRTEFREHADGEEARILRVINQNIEFAE